MGDPSGAKRYPSPPGFGSSFRPASSVGTFAVAADAPVPRNSKNRSRSLSALREPLSQRRHRCPVKRLGEQRLRQGQAPGILVGELCVYPGERSLPPQQRKRRHPPESRHELIAQRHPVPAR
jgi:hypothetical protein